MKCINIATILVVVYPVAFIIIYGLSCIAHREFKSEMLVNKCKYAIRETLVKDAIEGYGMNPESVRLLDEALTAIDTYKVPRFLQRIKRREHAVKML